MVMRRLAYSDSFANGDPEPLETEECLHTPLVIPLEDVTEVVASFTGVQFTKWLSCIQLGAELLYQGETNQILYDFLRMVDCPVSICEKIIDCLNNDEDVQSALASLILNNELIGNAINDVVSDGGAVQRGKPISENQATSNALPDNTSDEFGCIPDAIWGAVLYLVQSGNRTIEDFWDILELASNSLEAATIATQNIPVIGNTVSSATEFADFLQEVVREAYQAAYTETYEQELACTLFCVANENCELTPDSIIDAINARLTAPIDVSDFAEIIAAMLAGTFTGTEICDISFLLFFTALKYGQQFGSVLGIRPLTDLMGLGADALASDNWATLCDCPSDWVYDADLATLESWDDYAFADNGVYSSGNGWGQKPGGYNGVGIFGIATTLPFYCTSVEIFITSAMTGDQNGAVVGSLDLSVATQDLIGSAVQWEIPVAETLDGIAIGYVPNDSGSGYPDFPGYTYRVIVRGFGYQPPELGG